MRLDDLCVHVVVEGDGMPPQTVSSSHEKHTCDNPKLDASGTALGESIRIAMI